MSAAFTDTVLDTSDVDGVPDELPIYDPAEHIDPDLLVVVVLNSTSGRTLRQADPVRLVRPAVAEFVRRELDAGYGPASRTGCLAEAEKRRYAAHVVDGRDGDYVEPEFDARHGDDQVVPWPALADLADPAEEV